MSTALDRKVGASHPPSLPVRRVANIPTLVQGKQSVIILWIFESLRLEFPKPLTCGLVSDSHRL
jgi:hypothetical protein